LECRDFLIKPQYEYCAEGMLLHAIGAGDNLEHASVTDTTDHTSEASFDDLPEVPNVLILYGSQTGNAEAAARRLKRELRLLKPVMMTLNDAKGLHMVGRSMYTHVLAICSTFGDGSPPANAFEFFEAALPKFSGGKKFAVLGLGSTIYPRFCQAAENLDKLLHESGLESSVTLTKADEAAGADGTIDDWIKMIKAIIMPPNIQELLRESTLWQSHDFREPNKLRWLPSEEAHEFVPPTSSAGSLCLFNEELLGAQATSRSIRKITFKAPAKYESGDHLSVMPVNSDTMVTRFLQCFQSELQSTSFAGLLIDGDLVDQISKQPIDIQVIENGQAMPADVFFQTPTTLGYLLKHTVDLSLSSKDAVDLVKLVKEIVNERLEFVDVDDREIILGFPEIRSLLANAQNILDSESTARTQALDDFISMNPTIVDFLENNRECLLEPFFDGKPVLEMAEILCVLNRLQPRYYSISSSNKVSPDEISITVGILQVETSSGVKINGVCSNYLASLKGGEDQALVCVHKSSFRLPSDPQAPIMMVGAGTGLSPMMGFLDEKALDKKNGEAGSMIHLFFGCRTMDDLIYRGQIEELEMEGLIEFHLALSRSGPKMYVQDKIKELGKDAADLLLRKDTHYYVCGDAQMANSCYEYCIDVLRKYAGMSRVSAARHLKQMEAQGRWQADVWGILSNYESSKKNIMNSKRRAAMLWMQHFEA
jgi:sulfite reductase alpha subunit-like flavoprotein